MLTTGDIKCNPRQWPYNIIPPKELIVGASMLLSLLLLIVVGYPLVIILDFFPIVADCFLIIYYSIFNSICVSMLFPIVADCQLLSNYYPTITIIKPINQPLSNHWATTKQPLTSHWAFIKQLLSRLLSSYYYQPYDPCLLLGCPLVTRAQLLCGERLALQGLLGCATAGRGESQREMLGLIRVMINS